MGYTHYWKVQEDITADEWDKITYLFTSVRLECSNRGIVLANAHGESVPTVTEDEIVFNGSRKDDGDYETCRFQRMPSREFCKTQYRPYDLAVCAMLIIMRGVAGEKFSFASDGFGISAIDGQYYIEADWAEAVAFVRSILDHPSENIRPDGVSIDTSPRLLEFAGGAW